MGPAPLGGCCVTGKVLSPFTSWGSSMDCGVQDREMRTQGPGHHPAVSSLSADRPGESTGWAVWRQSGVWGMCAALSPGPPQEPLIRAEQPKKLMSGLCGKTQEGNTALMKRQKEKVKKKNSF